MKSFMNRFQHNIDLLNLSLLFNGFEFMLLKNALVLCLNDEYTDSTKLLSPKGLHIIPKPQPLENFPKPRSPINSKHGPSITVLQNILHKNLCDAFLRGKTLMDRISFLSTSMAA
jgi:hypothetical protein